MARYTRALINASLAVAALAIGGCGSDRATAPRPFDPERVTADVDATISSLSAAPFESFAAMSLHFGLSPFAGSVAGSARDFVAQGDTRASATERIGLVTRRLLGVSATSSVPVFEPAVLGTTYVFDQSEGRYVPSRRGGAPANGVRFILYAVNPVTHETVVGSEIGHADLLDEGRARASGIALRLLIVSNSITYLDYAVTVDGTPRSGTLGIVGAMTDGTTRANFRIAARAAATLTGFTTTVDFDFAVPSRRFGVTAALENTLTRGAFSENTHLTVRSEGGRIEYVVRGDFENIDATISVNGRRFATATGPRAHPEIRGAGGEALTEQEAHALRRILHLADAVGVLFLRLLQPLAAIFHLSMIP